MASGNIEPKEKTFITKSYTYKGSAGAPGVYWNVTRSNFKMTVPDGYTPFSFTAFNSGNEMIAVSRIQPMNTGTVASFKNVGTGNAVTPTFGLTVTYVPTELVEDVTGKHSVEISDTMLVNNGSRPTVGGMLVNPTTKEKINQLFFAPDDTICYSFPKHYTYSSSSEEHITFMGATITYSDGTSDKFYSNNGFSGDRYYRLMTMPSKSAVIQAEYKSGYFMNLKIVNGLYTASPDYVMLTHVIASGVSVTLTFQPTITYTSFSMTSSIALTRISDTKYSFTMPSNDISISFTFVE